jgi:hypothetical protein
MLAIAPLFSACATSDAIIHAAFDPSGAIIEIVVATVSNPIGPIVESVIAPIKPVFAPVELIVAPIIPSIRSSANVHVGVGLPAIVDV